MKEIITDFGAILCDGFYDYNRKYIDHSGVSISDKLRAEGELLDLMRDYAHRLSEYLGIRHLSRIDFFITRDGRALFNEINTMPGFTEGSLYPRLLSRAGINPSSAICDMLDDILAP